MCKRLMLSVVIIGLLSLTLLWSQEKKSDEKSVSKEPIIGDTKITPELQAKVEILIKQLGDDDWQKREQAQEELIKFGKDIIPLLEKVSKETKDPEIRSRCNTIVEKYWWEMAAKVVKENKIIRKELYLDSPKITEEKRENTLQQYLNTLEEIKIEDSKNILTKEIRFYRIPVPSEPPDCIKFGIAETGDVFINYKPEDISSYLKSVQTKEDSIKIAIMIARLTLFCYVCGTNRQVDSKKVNVVNEKGLFKVTIPANAITPNSNDEGAEIDFDTDGKLLKIVKTGHKGKHL